jgi:hypothetical protein
VEDDGMERVIATHHLEGHRIDVVESVDDENMTVRLVIDGELLSPDTHPDRAPTADEAASLLTSWQAGRDTGAPRQVANSGGLLPREVIALLEALDDEHKAHATYAQVLADFGDVLPFANIIEAEARHIDALTRLMHRYQVPVPSNPWTGKVPRFASVKDACAAGVEAEIDNGSLYDRLMAATQRADILEVFRNLQEASQQRHLPAFQRCLERGGPGGGRDGERGRGGGQHRHRGGA